MSIQRDPCPFCTPSPDRVFLETEQVLGLWDGFPVSPGHALLVTRRHVPTWFDATADEQQALTAAIAAARLAIEMNNRPTGYNVGFNACEAAGQTVFHLHVHVIPRYQGDTPDPRGGVRGVIPGKAVY
jgi:diadenosine tetraphosphate (Ap4A) HIT family hydrolase